MISRDAEGPGSKWNRRAFLRAAGWALAGAGGSGCARSSLSKREAVGAGPGVRVRVDGDADPLVGRAWEVLRRRVEERVPVRWIRTRSSPRIHLTLDEGLDAEAFRLESIGDAVRISGGSGNGLLYGVGKFLRTSRYDGAFEPSKWRGASKPRGSLRGMYFASHFHNWYHQASEAEIVRYLEDLSLWGVNA
ncbi:MAG: hypothetical protein JNL97_07510, partial [Verrucomicrobiales bacterium]|nr:hypothetical protein [Verrucomicrobiales bacterium]